MLWSQALRLLGCYDSTAEDHASGLRQSVSVSYSFHYQGEISTSVASQ
jgi:hypothetical protein